MSIHLKPNTSCFLCSNFAPGQTFLVLLSADICAWKGKILLSSLQQPATFCVCVCQQPKILAVLLTPSSTCCLPKRCIYNIASKSSTSLTLPRKLLPSASQQSVTSTSQSNSNTVCSDIFRLTPVCPLIISSHGCLKVTFSVSGVNKKMTFSVVLTLFRPDFML